jgi:predicted HTH transcriptional regulator
MLGMANRRDGGSVIIGVGEELGRLTTLGLDANQHDGWKFDHLADAVAEYADPSIDFSLTSVELDSSKYVALQMNEFAEVPLVCKKTYHRDNEVILRQGACYIRSRRKPETIEVSSYADMRDLIDLATDKGVRRFVERAHGAGLGLIAGSARESPVELFNEELGDFQ